MYISRLLPSHVCMYVSYMSQHFCLFLVSNLSCLNFRIFLLMHPGSVTADRGGVSGEERYVMSARQLDEMVARTAGRNSWLVAWPLVNLTRFT